MHLQASLGASSMHMYGQSGSARAAMERGLAIAEARGDFLYQVDLFSTLTMFHTRVGDIKTALHYAKLGQGLAGAVGGSDRYRLSPFSFGEVTPLYGRS